MTVSFISGGHWSTLSVLLLFTLLITLWNLQGFLDPVDSRSNCLRMTTTNNYGHTVMKLRHVTLWVTWTEKGRVRITLICLTLPHFCDSPKPGNRFIWCMAGSFVCVYVFHYLLFLYYFLLFFSLDYFWNICDGSALMRLTSVWKLY